MVLTPKKRELPDRVRYSFSQFQIAQSMFAVVSARSKKERVKKEFELVLLFSRPKHPSIQQDV